MDYIVITGVCLAAGLIYIALVCWKYKALGVSFWRFRP